MKKTKCTVEQIMRISREKDLDDLLLAKPLYFMSALLERTQSYWERVSG